MKTIKIVIEEKNENNVNATVYIKSDEKSEENNVGTLWLMHEELDLIANSLTLGMPDECQLIIYDETGNDDLYIDD